MIMPSLFLRLPWAAETLGDKSPLPELSAPNMSNIPLKDTKKRKRADTAGNVSPTTTDVNSHKRRCLDDRARDVSAKTPSNTASNTASKPQLSTPPLSLDSSMTTPPILGSTDMSPIQQAIEHHCNLEILVKHRELRFIEQELAKCQVALEQLRRCELVPYPGTGEPSVDVSAGTGPAIQSLSFQSQPTAPSPWGVTDGPYTRHYAQWLVTDPQFDAYSLPGGNDPSAVDTSCARSVTRNSASGSISSSRRRSSRDVWTGSFSAPVSATPTAAPTPTTRGRGGPLIIKRLSDTQLVKLVCSKCHRTDFSSVQGFLNHCRIAHKIDYKSHEAAAQDCGHVLEPHEADLAVHVQPAQTHQPRTSVSVAPAKAAPVVSSQTKPAPVTVSHPAGPHWLNSANTTTAHRPLKLKLSKQGAKPPTAQTPSSVPKVEPSPAAAAFQSTPFAPATGMPYLSAQFTKRGVGGDLDSVKTGVQEPIAIDSDGEHEEDEASSFNASPLKAESFGQEQGGRKGYRLPPARMQQAHSSSVNKENNTSFASSVNSQSSRSASLDHGADSGLSPHTVDSLPGMISDHGEDLSEPEEEAGPTCNSANNVKPASALGMGQGCGTGDESLEIDVQVDDNHDEHGVLIRRRDMMN